MIEYNNEPRESAEAPRERAPEEMSGGGDNRSAREYVEAQESAGRAVKRKHTGLPTGLAAVFAVTVAAVAVTSAANAPKGEAAIGSASVTDTTVSYLVEVTEGEDLRVVLYNDFTRREAPLLPGSNEGVFSDLQPAMQYTLAVLGEGAFGETELAARAVRTDALPTAPPALGFYGVWSECTCAIDGCFHFKLDFEDEGGVWTAFSATLTDAYGTVSACDFSEDAHAEQTIDVTRYASLLGKTAEFVVWCTEQGQTVELYRATVKI